MYSNIDDNMDVDKCYQDCSNKSRLIITYKYLTILPLLSSRLRLLNCSHNKLTELPKLPNTLIELFCQKNKLNKLPKLPPNLKILSCDHNNLNRLPNLPESLIAIWCHYNLLRKLPIIPLNLEILNCSNNRLLNNHYIPKSLIHYSSKSQLPFPSNQDIVKKVAKITSNCDNYISTLKELLIYWVIKNKIKVNKLNIPIDIKEIILFKKRFRCHKCKLILPYQLLGYNTSHKHPKFDVWHKKYICVICSRKRMRVKNIYG